jgi:hypothetical protein
VILKYAGGQQNIALTVMNVELRSANHASHPIKPIRPTLPVLRTDVIQALLFSSGKALKKA